MALSVLHRRSLTDHEHCGVWDSVKKKWVLSGHQDDCYAWKHLVEADEQEESNRLYFLELAKERSKMGMKS